MSTATFHKRDWRFFCLSLGFLCVRNLYALVTSHIAHLIHLDALSQLGGMRFQCKSCCHFVAIAHYFPSFFSGSLGLALPVDKLSHLNMIRLLCASYISILSFSPRYSCDLIGINSSCRLSIRTGCSSLYRAVLFPLFSQCFYCIY